MQTAHWVSHPAVRVSVAALGPARAGVSWTPHGCCGESHVGSLLLFHFAGRNSLGVIV